MWGRKIDAFSKASLFVLGWVQGTHTSKLSAIFTLEQKWFINCLCTFPGWAPQLPVCAIATKSSWTAPSWMAQSANSLTKVALSCPLAQRNSNLFARFDSDTPSAFSKALLAFACCEIPDSISSSHPLSLLAINYNILFQRISFSKEYPFPKNILFQRISFYIVFFFSLNIVPIRLEPKSTCSGLLLHSLKPNHPQLCKKKLKPNHTKTHSKKKQTSKHSNKRKQNPQNTPSPTKKLLWGKTIWGT